MLFRPNIDQDLPLPGLPRLEHRQIGSHRDLYEILRLGLTGNRLADLVLGEIPSASQRDESGEVPFALERDPGSLPAPLGNAVQVLANYGPSDEPNRPN